MGIDDKKGPEGQNEGDFSSSDTVDGRAQTLRVEVANKSNSIIFPKKVLKKLRKPLLIDAALWLKT